MGKKMNEMWDSIFEDFEFNYPNIANRVIDWYPSGRMEIVVTLDDNTKRYFNFLDKTIRHAFDGESEYESEDDWRQMFARKLKKKMHDSFITHPELSELTGISTVTLSKYVSGKSTPSTYNIQKIARALNCSVYELIE